MWTWVQLVADGVGGVGKTGNGYRFRGSEDYDCVIQVLIGETLTK